MEQLKTNDPLLHAAMVKGDIRGAVKILFGRRDRCYPAGRYAEVKAEAYALRKQAEMNATPAAVAFEKMRTEFLVKKLRGLKPGSTLYKSRVKELQEMNAEWQRRFCVYRKEKERMEKVLEAKEFIRRHRKFFY